MKNNSITKILIGLIFTYLDIRFLNINIYTGLIGIVFLLIGVSQLKNEDLLFSYAYKIAKVNTATIFINMLVCAIGFNISTLINTTFLVLNALLLLAFSVCLFSGLAKLSIKTKNRVFVARFKRNILTFFIIDILMLITYFATFLKYVTIPIIILLYLLIISTVYKYRKKVNKKLFGIKEHKVNIKIALVTFVSITALVGLGYWSLNIANAPKLVTKVFSLSDIEDLQPIKQTQIEDIKSLLKTSGFPEEILKDLPNSEILLFSGAKSVNVKTNIEKNNGGELELTSVVTKLDSGEIKFLEYYKWLKFPKDEYTDLIGASINKSIFDLSNTNLKAYHLVDKEVNGKVLSYQKKNLKAASNNEILASKFKNENIGTNQRGYITFTAKLLQTNEPLEEFVTAITYVHQTSLYNMPYKDIYDMYDINKAESNHTAMVFQSYILKTSEPV